MRHHRWIGSTSLSSQLRVGRNPKLGASDLTDLARQAGSDYRSAATFSDRLGMRMSFFGSLCGVRCVVCGERIGQAGGQAVGPIRPDESGQRLDGATDMLTAGDVSNAFTWDLPRQPIVQVGKECVEKRKEGLPVGSRRTQYPGLTSAFQRFFMHFFCRFK